ncbi:IGHMBP2 family helicase [Methanosphaera sp. BMS]|uniref:IGHMBP2 family helicase n=1 Tax=Methanosphaera sp. BMS TaxID=1789762 RepID=UPI000DC1E00D|nr:IGHMBP2 family helicase [Methanosphaera sp. BMS]AWX32417.1 AAA family ATPase [Methanosphaera sp. BMS]
MKRYIERLITLINYEREEEVKVMVNEIKKMTSYEREQIGRAVNNMKGKRLAKELGMTIVQYGRKKRIDCEINVGDVVLISTDNPLKSNLTATVTEKGGRYLQVAFESKVPRWALKKKVRLDLYVNDVTFRRMEDNLKNLSINAKHALEYHLNMKSPKKENDVYLEYIDTSLNDSQKLAVKNALSSQDFYLIHGPFGTGKTRTLVELIYQELRQDNKVLATAESNTAVDNLLERLAMNEKINITRLGHPQRVSSENIKHTLAYKINSHPLGANLESYYNIIDEYNEEKTYYTKPKPQLRRGLTDNQIKRCASKNKSTRGVDKKIIQSMARWIDYDEKVKEIYDKVKVLEDKIVREIIEESDVIVSTNSSAALDVIAKYKFDVAVIDEASQTTIPSVLIPIAKAHRFILAGDHKQLPPTVISTDAYELEETLFESLIEKYPHKGQLLNVQYRMNDELMRFSNSQFYDNLLETDSSVFDITLNDFDINDEKTMEFIDTSNMNDNREAHLNDSKSFVNRTEARICIELANDYLDKGVKKEDIGIISPYADQVKLISEHIDVEVKSVDGFQGREKEIIIISTVRSNDNGELGFLNDLRRLNVAITRAKRKLIIVGNQDTLKYNRTYEKLIKSSLY